VTQDATTEEAKNDGHSVELLFSFPPHVVLLISLIPRLRHLSFLLFLLAARLRTPCCPFACLVRLFFKPRRSHALNMIKLLLLLPGI